jgi:ribonuclease P protein subunit POP4
MSPTPETLPRHELVGLRAAVVEAADPSRVGIAGEVVSETTKTLAIEGAERVWTVPKADATFVIDLPSGQAVTVEGDRLVARPARRSEQEADSTWR